MNLKIPRPKQLPRSTATDTKNDQGNGDSGQDPFSPERNPFVPSCRFCQRLAGFSMLILYGTFRCAHKFATWTAILDFSMLILY